MRQTPIRTPRGTRLLVVAAIGALALTGAAACEDTGPSQPDDQEQQEQQDGGQQEGGQQEGGQQGGDQDDR